MDNKLGGQGTTLDGDMGQTREIMHDSAQAVVPKLSMVLGSQDTDLGEMQKAPDHLTALSDERKEEIRRSAGLKLDFVQQQYWKLRNDKQDHMMCPYCLKENREDEELCCEMFNKAFAAILERQNQVDVAASHVRACHKVGLVH